MIGIYKIISPKGKIYIGQSTDIMDRWYKGHKYNSGTGRKLKNSFNKYGWDNHIHEIIEECSADQLDERETYWINFYDSFNKGLNSTRTGGSQGYHDIIWKANQSEGMKGRKGYWTGKKRPEHSEKMKSRYNEEGSTIGLKYIRTDAHKHNLSLKLSGNKFSKESCSKISANKLGKNGKSVICVETQQVFNSLSECGKVMNISVGCICRFVQGKYGNPKLKGYTFKYM